MISGVAIFSSAVCRGQQEEVYFSAEDLNSDLQYLKSKLETIHPALHLYSSRAEVEQYLNDLSKEITRPLTGTDFYRIVTQISPLIKDGHTIILPSQANQTFHTNHSKFFPYQLICSENKLYVQHDFTAQQTLAAGAEILSINGKDAADIIKELTERQVRDGQNLSYPRWILNNYFRQYYNFIMGHPAIYQITFTRAGTTSAAMIQALSKDSINNYRQKNDRQLTLTPLPKEALLLKIDSGNHTALLTIRDFHNSILKKQYHQHFKKEIGGFFRKIKAADVGSLIIDLRNNQGGDIANGVFLLSYIMNAPFEVVREYYKLRHQALQRCKGPATGTHKLRPDHFTGSLYVLINGGSFSNSAIVSSCLSRAGRAVFVGEETGGCADVISGFIKNVTLPKTGIQVQVPARQFILTDKSRNTGHGIRPQHVVVPSVNDLLEGRDVVLEYAKNLIKKANSQL